MQDEKEKNNKNTSVKRFGMVIELREECAEEYIELHRGEGVRDLLSESNISNFNIFLKKFPDGKLYEFGYYEYHGEDYEADMAKLDQHPRNIEWLKVCDAMQVPLPGSSSWSMMDSIYFNP